jgi:hypothetical protein
VESTVHINYYADFFVRLEPRRLNFRVRNAQSEQSGTNTVLGHWWLFFL